MSSTERLGGSVSAGLYDVAVLVPCHNEERTIARVVADFRTALPKATVYVYDNNSSDRTIDLATEAGAVVRAEIRQGKGHVVRRMFSDIEADVYVLVDGDATYDAASAPTMVAMLIEDRLDMLVAARLDREEAAYRRGHRAGNWLLTRIVTYIFGRAFTDILSGYRVFSRRFVKSFPGLSRGFEIETELTVHALELELPVKELPTPYYSRPPGSASKLSTWDDGFRILSDDPQALPRRAATSVLWVNRPAASGRLCRPRHPNSHHVFSGGPSPAFAYCGTLNRSNAAWLSFDCGWFNSRHCHARPP